MKNIKYQVRCILEDYSRTRDDDDFLYVMYLYTNFEQAVLDQGGRWYVDMLAKVPSYDSVTRRRRELQAEYDHLKASDLCQRRRIKHQGELLNDLGIHQSFGKEIGEQNKHLEVIALR